MRSENEIRQIAQGELRSAEERLLWVSAPIPGEAARRALPGAFVGIPFTAFALFWMWAAGTGFGRGSGAPLPFVLFGSIFVIVGLSILLSPLWAYLNANKQVFAITNTRAFIVTDGFSGRNVRSYGDEDIHNLERRERSNGIGDLVFDRHQYTVRRSNGSRSTRTEEHGFFGVPDVRQAERILLETFKQ